MADDVHPVPGYLQVIRTVHQRVHQLDLHLFQCDHQLLYLIGEKFLPGQRQYFL